MDSQSIELTFDNRLGDHLAAERLYYRSTLFWKLDKVVAVLLVVFGAYLVWGVGPRWWTLIWFPLAVAEWFNVLSVRPLQVIFWFKHNPKFSETYHLTIGDSGIHFRTKSIDSRVAWDHYSRTMENERLLLLIYGTRMYTMIPTRVFKDATEINKFRALVMEHVGAKPGKGT
jgi:hypothetical protein